MSTLGRVPVTSQKAQWCCGGPACVTETGGCLLQPWLWCWKAGWVRIQYPGLRTESLWVNPGQARVCDEMGWRQHQQKPQHPSQQMSPCVPLLLMQIDLSLWGRGGGSFSELTHDQWQMRDNLATPYGPNPKFSGSLSPGWGWGSFKQL